MKKVLLNNATYLDIIFEGRNKDYGAYELRYNYPERLKRSMAIGFCFVALVISSAFINFGSELPEIITPQGSGKTHVLTPVSFAVPKVAVPKTSAGGGTDIATEIAPDKQVQRPLIEQPIKGLAPGPISGGGPTLSGAGGGTLASDSGTIPISTPPITKTVPPIVETPIEEDIDPSFPGGLEALRVYLSNQLVFPAEDVSGISTVEFTVQADGRVTDIHLLKGFNKACDMEALRIACTMPKWLPGRYHGKAVASKYTLPVHFEQEEAETP
jgi:periplasmic protein TonB